MIATPGMTGGLGVAEEDQAADAAAEMAVVEVANAVVDES